MGSEFPILSRKTRNGYCSFCGCWLGSSDTCHDASQKLSSWDFFVVSNISDLLKNEMVAKISANSIKDFIDKLINKTGGLTAFSQCFSIPKSTANEWHSGLHKPSLYIILKLCYSLLSLIFTGKEGYNFCLRAAFNSAVLLYISSMSAFRAFNFSSREINSSIFFRYLNNEFISHVSE